MRIALEATGETGRRAARVLLSDPRLEALGIVGERPGRADPRLEPVEAMKDWDLLVSDTDSSSTIEDAHRSCLSVVSAGDRLHLSDRAPAVAGANPTSGLPAAVVAVLRRRFDEVEAVFVAWTAPSETRGGNEWVVFPPPLGPLRGAPVAAEWPGGAEIQAVRVASSDDLYALAVTVEGRRGGLHERRSVGLIDHSAFVAGITLAAGATTLALKALAPVARHVSEASTVYLEEAMRAGLALARYRPNG